jgi:hypothetical protein
VLSGKTRLLLGDYDLVHGSGEVAEFHTRLPHWFSSADGNVVEVLSLVGQHGEAAHVRAKSDTRSVDPGDG